MSDQSANLEVMTKAARKAARGLMHDFNEVEHLQVSRKGASDFVSKADKEAEKTIKEILMEARPNYGWVGEESDRINGADPTRYWIVDPLDGTTNFLHGLPHWAISIALEQKGEIVAGVIFDPLKAEMFTAQKGSGAWLNDKRIRVSGRSDLSESIFATGIPFNGRGDLSKTLSQLANLMPTCAGVRRNGAAALDLAYVAAGRFEGFWEDALSTWDIAAGDIIAREAGALVKSHSIEGDPHKTGSIIAANSLIFESFEKALRNA